MRRCRFVAGVLGRGRTPSSLQGCAFGEASGGIGVSSAGGGGGGGEAPWSVHARTAQRMRATEREERKREVSQPSATTTTTTTTATLPLPPTADWSSSPSSSARPQGGGRRQPSPPQPPPPKVARAVPGSGRLPSPPASPLAAFARRVSSGGAAAPAAGPAVAAAPRGNPTNDPAARKRSARTKKRRREAGLRRGQDSDTLLRSRVRPGAQALLRPEEGRAGLGGMVSMPDEAVARYLRENFGGRTKEQDSAAKALQLNLIRRELRSLVAAACVVGPRTKSVLMSLYGQLGAHGMAADVFVSALEAVQGSTARVHSNALAAGLLSFARAKRFDAVPPLLGDGRLRPLVADDDAGAALNMPVSLANALLTCFVNAPPGHAVLTRARARSIFQRMADGGLADAQTRALHLRGGGTLEGAAAGGVTSKPLLSAMLKAAAREGGVAAAEKVWAAHAAQVRMDGEEATPAYNTMLQVAREEADPDAVLRWMQRMADAGVPSDAFTYAIAIGAWVEASQSRGDRFHRLASETFSLACSSGCGGNVKVCGGMAQLHAATKDVAAMKKLEEHMHLCNVLVTSVIRDYMMQCRK
eukprot:Rhum_TRINITY_DN13955_c0_g2::Rhum_TRINITY_DN13955_c0_g2_i2::g.66232::m.66232